MIICSQHNGLFSLLHVFTLKSSLPFHLARLGNIFVKRGSTIIGLLRSIVEESSVITRLLKRLASVVAHIDRLPEIDEGIYWANRISVYFSL